MTAIAVYEPGGAVICSDDKATYHKCSVSVFAVWAHKDGIMNVNVANVI